VAVAVEVNGADLAFQPDAGRFANDVELSLLAVDQSGKAKDGAHDTLELRLKPETHDLVSRSGIRYARRLALPPGRYQLRVGARESGGGHLGTVLYDLEVPDFTKPDLAMSGLLLTSRTAGRIPSMNPDPELTQVLPSPPVVFREFPQVDVLSLYTEIYDNQSRTPHRVAITTTLTSDDGRVLFTETDERSSAEIKGPTGGYGYAASIPLAEVPAGRYVLEVQARSLLADGPTVARQLELTVR
jgi:hypothetical protein